MCLFLLSPAPPPPTPPPTPPPSRQPLCVLLLFLNGHNVLVTPVLSERRAMWFWCQTGLKVGIEGIDCRSEVACVEHATCDSSASLQCVCDNNYGPRADGTCGTLIFSFLLFSRVQCKVQIFVLCTNSPRLVPRRK